MHQKYNLSTEMLFQQLTLGLSIIDANNDANFKDYEYETV